MMSARSAIWACSAAILLVLCGQIDRQSKQPQEPISAGYSGPWVNETRAEISRTLAAAGTHGCGEYRYKARPGADVYLVECTRDGSTWRAYLVFPRIGKVSGPFTPD